MCACGDASNPQLARFWKKEMPTFRTHRFLSILGLLLDVIGVLSICIAVIQIENKKIYAETLADLEDELNTERQQEGAWSIIGAILITLGFILIVSAEIMQWIHAA
jgi:predicted ferric reductase